MMSSLAAQASGLELDQNRVEMYSNNHDNILGMNTLRLLSQSHHMSQPSITSCHQPVADDHTHSHTVRCLHQRSQLTPEFLNAESMGQVHESFDSLGVVSSGFRLAAAYYC